MPKQSVIYDKEYLKKRVLETAMKMCKMIDVAAEELPKDLTYNSDFDGQYEIYIDIEKKDKP